MMDVKTLCLGALMGGKATGYDIKKLLDEGSSAGLVEASFGSIYPALAKAEAEGLVMSEAASGRGEKKLYAITEAGRRHLIARISGPLGEERFRSPFMFALLFAELLPRERVAGMIDAQLAEYEAKRLKLQGFVETASSESERFVFGFGLAMYEAAMRFMRERRAPLEASAGTAREADAVPVREMSAVADAPPGPEPKIDAAVAAE